MGSFVLLGTPLGPGRQHFRAQCFGSQLHLISPSPAPLVRVRAHPLPFPSICTCKWETEQHNTPPGLFPSRENSPSWRALRTELKFTQPWLPCKSPNSQVPSFTQLWHRHIRGWLSTGPSWLGHNTQGPGLCPDPMIVMPLQVPGEKVCLK